MIPEGFSVKLIRSTVLKRCFFYAVIRLRLNTRQLAAGMKGKANRAEAR